MSSGVSSLTKTTKTISRASTPNGRGPQSRRDPAKALYNDAVEAARSLKKKHRSYYTADPLGFRAYVRQAHNCVFRLKPGPKADARIVQAAQLRAHGAAWKDLYPECIDGYGTMSEYTRSLAEEGFRKKVNTYLQRHPRRRQRWARTTEAKNSHTDEKPRLPAR
jgi:hypothetical protein